MNSDPKDLQPLLDKVLAMPGRIHALSRADLVAMIRHEHSRRRRLRRAFAFAAALAAISLVIAWPRSRRAEQLAAGGPPARPDIVIHHVDDQQLLALLKDTPVALMEWPNGERTLLVVETPGDR
jgi:hypothetical protein